MELVELSLLTNGMSKATTLRRGRAGGEVTCCSHYVQMQARGVEVRAPAPSLHQGRGEAMTDRGWEGGMFWLMGSPLHSLGFEGERNH